MAEDRQARTIKDRDELLLKYLYLVRAIAVVVHDGLPVCVDLDDLISAGVAGLIQAAEKFDPSQKVLFSTYARYRIKGAMLDSLRQLDWASREFRRRQKAVEAAIYDLTFALGRNPTESEIAEKCGMSIESWRALQVDLRSTVTPLSLSTRKSKFDDLPDPDCADKPALQPDNICLEGELRERLLSALDVLKPRYRKVIELYYREDLTMLEIGRRLGVNESRICQMHAVALGKLRKRLQSAGITSAKAFVAAA